MHLLDKLKSCVKKTNLKGFWFGGNPMKQKKNDCYPFTQNCSVSLFYNKLGTDVKTKTSSFLTHIS